MWYALLSDLFWFTYMQVLRNWTSVQHTKKGSSQLDMNSCWWGYSELLVRLVLLGSDQAATLGGVGWQRRHRHPTRGGASIASWRQTWLLPRRGFTGFWIGGYRVPTSAAMSAWRPQQRRRGEEVGRHAVVVDAYYRPLSSRRVMLSVILALALNGDGDDCVGARRGWAEGAWGTSGGECSGRYGSIHLTLRLESADPDSFRGSKEVPIRFIFVGRLSEPMGRPVPRPSKSFVCVNLIFLIVCLIYIIVFLYYLLIRETFYYYIMVLLLYYGNN